MFVAGRGGTASRKCRGGLMECQWGLVPAPVPVPRSPTGCRHGSDGKRHSRHSATAYRHSAIHNQHLLSQIPVHNAASLLLPAAAEASTLELRHAAPSALGTSGSRFRHRTVPRLSAGGKYGARYCYPPDSWRPEARSNSSSQGERLACSVGARGCSGVTATGRRRRRRQGLHGRGRYTRS